MNKRECERLVPGDRVRHGQTTGVVMRNGEQITVQWDNGKSSTGKHRHAWMIEVISMIINRGDQK